MTVRARDVAALAEAIERVRTLEGPADAALRAFFRDHPQMGQHDRGLIADGAFAYLRHLRSIGALAQTEDPRRLALAVIVRHLSRSVRDVAPAVSAANAEWLATFKSRLLQPLPAAVAADLPDWLWVRLGAIYGDEGRTSLALALAQPAPLDLRVNPMKASRDHAVAALAADGMRVAVTPFAPLGIRVEGRPMLAKHPWFVDGRLEVQDEGSQIVAHLVAPKRTDMVVDFCAGAGGKTLLLGALMRSQGRLYAFDVVSRRLASLMPRLTRSGLSNVNPQLIASERDPKVKRLAAKIDRVLVDAPCTGFGTLRRNPDLKWRQSPADVGELAAKQASILAAASTLVKPGGRLVYATCSVLPEENEAVVDAFLSAQRDFTTVDAAAELARMSIPLDTGRTLKLRPDLHRCDGFFAAILQRAAV